MRKKWKQVLAGASAVVMTASLLPVYSQAEGEEQQVDVSAPVMKVTFDDGTAEDVTGNDNDGVVHGTPEFVNGKSGKAVHIVNSNDIAGEGQSAEQYISFGQTDDLKFGTDDFSIAFWYKSDRSDSKHKEGAILSNKDWDSGSNEGLNFGDMSQGINMNYRAGGSGRKETDRFSEITDGECILLREHLIVMGI